MATSISASLLPVYTGLYAAISTVPSILQRQIFHSVSSAAPPCTTSSEGHLSVGFLPSESKLLLPGLPLLLKHSTPLFSDLILLNSTASKFSFLACYISGFPFVICAQGHSLDIPGNYCEMLFLLSVSLPLLLPPLLSILLHFPSSVLSLLFGPGFGWIVRSLHLSSPSLCPIPPWNTPLNSLPKAKVIVLSLSSFP